MMTRAATRLGLLSRIRHAYAVRLQARPLSLVTPLAAAQRRFAVSHEWIVAEGGKGMVGVSQHAQEQLGDIVYVEVAGEGINLTKGDIAGTVESVKAASDIYAPVSGTVIEKNAELDGNPHLLNKEPYGKGWLFKIELKDEGQLKDLMSESEYEAHLKDVSSDD